MKKIAWIMLLVFSVSAIYAQSVKKEVNRDPLLKVDESNRGEFNAYKAMVPGAKAQFTESEPEYRSMGGLPVFAKYKDGPKVKLYSEDGLPVWVEGRLPGSVVLPLDARQQAMTYLQFMGRQMQIKEPMAEFALSEDETDELHIRHITYTQMLGGIEVFGAEVKVHADADGPYLMNGRYFPTPDLTSLTPTVSEVQAIQNVKNDVSRLTTLKTLTDQELKLVKDHVQVKSKLVIYHKNNDAHAKRLAWHIEIYPNVAHRYEYFVDALTGNIIHSYNTICGLHNQMHHSGECHAAVMNPLDGPATANAIDLNNKPQLLNTYQAGSKYYLIDITKPMFKPAQSNLPTDAVGVIATLDGLNKSPENAGFTVADVTSTTNTWTDKSSVSAHYNGAKSYDYFLATHNRNSIDGSGGNILSLINIADSDGGGLDNAFWNGQAMFYGNGKIGFTPLAGGLDVAGHEMTHGVVEKSANLVYQNESGALNESFADVFGVMIDRDNWNIGETVAKKSYFPTGIMRSMSDPHNGGNSLNDNGWQPKHMNEKYNGGEDNGGVHINSGITNHAFYLFATNPSVGKEKAEKVYYRALTQYLVKSSVFIDARAAVVQAAKDLYGNSSAEVTAAENAFAQVGIGTGGSSSGDKYQKNLNPNPGSDFIVATDASPNQVYLAHGNGFATIDVISGTTPKSRFSVTDDGSAIFYVGEDENIHAIQINYSNGQVTETKVSTSPVWGNVAVSKDGSRIAMVSNAVENKITVYDFNLQQGQTFTLYNPSYSGSITGNVLYADALEWDYSGNYVMYDAYNEIKNQAGSTINYWDIGFIRVFDKKKNTFGDGNISKLYSGLPENTSIGNPVFSKNSPYIVAFDYIDEIENTVYLVGGNIETGKEDAISNQSDLFVPNYSRLDNYIIGTVNTNEIHAFQLASDKISYGGSSTQLFTDASNGYWFGNGTRTINVATHEPSEKITNWTVFPNLVNNSVVIKAVNDMGNGVVQIVNSTGNTVRSAELNPLGKGVTQHINLSDLPAGAYFMRIMSGNNYQTEKIIKQ